MKRVVIILAILLFPMVANAQSETVIELLKYQINQLTKSLAKSDDRFVEAQNKVVMIQNAFSERLIKVEASIAEIKGDTSEIKDAIKEITREKTGMPSPKEILLYALIVLFSGGGGFALNRAYNVPPEIKKQMEMNKQ